ncbi:Hypothetical predicted protein, partial [Mytilus galloprovincialis]
ISYAHNIYAYIFGGVGAFAIVSLCTMFYKIRCYRSTQVGIAQVFETNSIAEVNEFESVYEEIDEIVLDEFIQQSNRSNIHVDEISSSSSSTDKNPESNLDDYLNPYQLILQTTEHHTYKSISDFIGVAAIERRDDSACVDMNNPTYVEQDEHIRKSVDVSKSLCLKYSDLEIDGKQVRNDIDSYENTRIFRNDVQKERKSSPQPKSSTEYAEIIHTG